MHKADKIIHQILFDELYYHCCGAMKFTLTIANKELELLGYILDLWADNTTLYEY